MDHREIVATAWKQAGVNDIDNPGLREFLRQFAAARDDCWPHAAQKFREFCPECLEELALPIWNTGDRMLRLGLLAVLDAKRDDDRKLLQKLVALCRPLEDVMELQVIHHKDHPELFGPLDAKLCEACSNVAGTAERSQLDALRGLVELKKHSLRSC